jgi:hypothetical protein
VWIDINKDQKNKISKKKKLFYFSDVRERWGAAGGAGGQEAEAGTLRNLSRLS